MNTGSADWNMDENMREQEERKLELDRQRQALADNARRLASDDGKTTWRELLSEALKQRGESLADIVFTTLTEDEMDERFCDGYGYANGVPFTAWTTGFVYFPVVYDGAEWVESVPRNPCGEKKEHVGGG